MKKPTFRRKSDWETLAGAFIYLLGVLSTIFILAIITKTVLIALR